MISSKRTARLSTATKVNWWFDAAVFLFALLALFSARYFFFLPPGFFVRTHHLGLDPHLGGRDAGRRCYFPSRNPLALGDKSDREDVHERRDHDPSSSCQRS